MKRTLFALALLAIPATYGFAQDEATFLTRVRQLTFEGRRSGEGYFSPDGKALTFQSEREPGNPFYQIYRLDLTTGDSVRVSPGMGKTTCSFIRPGTGEILFASTHLDPKSEAYQAEEFEMRAEGNARRYAWDYDPQFDIFVSAPGSSELTRLTSALGYDAEGSYSPDGSKIVFASNRRIYEEEGSTEGISPEQRKILEINPATFADIYIMNADGSEQTRLTAVPGYDGGPFFSPDGGRIIWRRFNEEGTLADVYTMKLDGSDVRRLTDFASMSWAPYFHPSGEYAIFASNKLGFENFELFIVDAAGEKEPVRATFTDGFDGLPVFSPEGDELCWTSTRYHRGTGRAGGQLFFGLWNHKAALEALAAAPPRESPTSQSASPAASQLSSRATTNDTPASRPAANDLPASRPSANESSGDNTTTAIASPPSLRRVSAKITQDDLRTHIEFLASPELAGRLTGTEGERMAAVYIATRFVEAGLAPLPGEEAFELEFSFTAGVGAGAGNELVAARIEPNPHMPVADLLDKAASPHAFTLDEDFRPLSFSGLDEATGSLAFAGYGLVVPDENGDVVYDSYENIDVTGKVVLVLRFVPEEVEPKVRQAYNRFAGLRYKALQARERGAVGLLVVAGPNSPGAGKLARMGLDFAGASSGIAAASITVEAADRLLASSGRTLKQLQDELDSGEARTALTLEDTAVRLKADLIKQRRTARNVVGILEPEGGVNANTEFVIIGAHYDHLGQGQGGNSLAVSGEEGEAHPGADDNASGVAVMLEVAARTAQEMTGANLPRERAIIFAAWTGEELGLLGSNKFVENATQGTPQFESLNEVPDTDPDMGPDTGQEMGDSEDRRKPFDLSKTVAYLNMDMVGRVQDNRLVVQGVGSSPEWRKLIERTNIRTGFSLSLTEDPYLPTDVMSFYLKKIPVLTLFSGAHEDYHRPTDTPDKINYPDLERVTEFMYALGKTLYSTDLEITYSEVERKGRATEGGREQMRAYLGTIPDYVTEIEGVKLSGVRKGGPADKAGLRGGDVIVNFGGQKIANIYDYTYALDAVKIGVAVKVVVQRDGERVTLDVTPEARE